MIITKEYKNDFDGQKFYMAKATLLNRTVTGTTRENALKNLRAVIRDTIRKQILGGYSVEAAGSTVNALAHASGGSTPSPPTFLTVK